MFKHVFTLLLALVLLCACAASTEQEGSESAPGVSGSASSEASVSEESFASDAGVGESAEESSAESVADSEDSVASSQPEESEEPNESSLPEESEEPVEPSQPEESEDPNESSEEEPPEPTDVKYVAVDSLSAPVLMLPCHTRDNLPTDFILAMQNNPVDIDYLAEYAETEGSLLQKYAAIWQAEVDLAAENLGDALGVLYKEEVLNYAAEAIFEGHHKIDLDRLYYLSLDEGAFLGEYLYSALDEGYLDVYRQTTFRLKYMLYLVETADGKTADLSLRFAHTPVYDGEADELVVVAADDGFLVRTPYSPSYTGEYGTSFIEAMKNNPIDQGQTITLEAFEAEIAFALEQMKKLLSQEAQENFDWYVYSTTATIRFDASWFPLLHDLGYIDSDLGSQQEIAGYRQVLFSLKYWTFVFETENGGEPNLAFAFSQ